MLIQRLNKKTAGVKNYNLPAVFFITILAVVLTSITQGCTGSDRDLPELLKRGTIRIAVPAKPHGDTLNKTDSYFEEQELAKRLSEYLTLDLELVMVDDYHQSSAKIISHDTDIVIRYLGDSDFNKDIILSIPYLHSVEILIQRDVPGKINTTEALKGKTICVNSKNFHYDTAKKLKRNIEDLKLKNISASLKPDDMINLVTIEKCFATITDSTFWDKVKDEYPHIDATLKLTKPQPISIAMHRESKKLKKKINEFLISSALKSNSRHKDDLNKIVNKHKTLRMVTTNSAFTYYIYKGTEMGFDYDLIKRFAEQNNLKLEVILLDDDTNTTPFSLLRSGKADIVADSLVITETLPSGIVFTEPYNFIDQLIAVRDDFDKIQTMEDLSSKKIYFQPNSVYERTLIENISESSDTKIIPVTDEMDMGDMLKALDSGKIDIAMTNSNHLMVEQSYGRNIKAALTLKVSQVGWAVRKENTELLKSLNNYIETEYRKLHFNLIKNKYFKDSKTIRQARDLNEFRQDKSGKLSPYDLIVKENADEFGIDWRLITAIMYEESNFITDKTSWVGAKGLMQVMDSTAKEMGVAGDIFDPKNSIYAGVKYFKHLVNRFEADIELNERIRFALASYNVGFGHVQDARALAIKEGFNPNKWFNNVDQALLKLSKKSYYKNSRYGYCRGREPVNYVKNIENRYNTYVLATDTNN